MDILLICAVLLMSMMIDPHLLSLSIGILLGYVLANIKKYVRSFFEYMKEKVDLPRYSSLLDRLITAIENVDPEETREIFIDIIYFIQGTTRYRPLKHVGDMFECPISKEEIRTGDLVLILPCGHKGKYQSMKEWVDTSPVCPICRQHC